MSGWARLWLVSAIVAALIGVVIGVSRTDLEADTAELTAEPPANLVFYPERANYELTSASYSSRACVPGTITAHVISEERRRRSFFGERNTVFYCTSWRRIFIHTLAGPAVVTGLAALLAAGLWVTRGFRSAQN